MATEPLDVRNDEIELYRSMSKVAGTLFLQFNKQLIAAVQKLAEGAGAPGNVPSGILGTLADRAALTQSEKAVLQKYGQEEIYRVWKKHLDTIDYSISFRPRVEKPVEGLNVMAVPGEKITIESVAADGAINASANWEIEIDLGIIRGKVSW